jgi:glycosyltransferase involved in cell wall biosynthesis
MPQVNDLRMMTLKKIKNLPLVSIGLPAYNAEPYIRECLDGIVNQTYENIEIIVSNNSSTDNTSTICLEYQKRDSRIKYHCQTENKGGLANFQFVLNEAKGKYFLWAAADDALELNWIEILVNLMEESPRSAMAFGLIKYINSNSEPVDCPRNIKSFKNINSQKTRLLRMIESIRTRSDLLYYGMHRRENLNNVKLAMSKLSSSDNEQSTALLYLVAAQGGIKSTTCTTLKYRVHQSGNSFKGKMLFKEIRILRKAHVDLANHYLKNYGNLYLIERFTFILILKFYFMLSDYFHLLRRSN